MIKYLGSKRVLIPTILEAIREVCPRPGTIIDLFSGTSRVGHALKAAGHRVLANDCNAYAHTLATCYVEADAEDVLACASSVIAELNGLAGRPGWFTQTYAEQSRYLHPDNAARVEAMRERIDAMGLEGDLRAVVLTSLLEAADRVDSTVAVQMAYLKAWAPRALKPLELRVPRVLPRAPAGKGRATCLEAIDAADALEGDVAYLDPPYNQHSYLGNYHVWETLVRWDRPEVYGTACKRVDVRTRRSAFNTRKTYDAAFAALVSRVRAPMLVVSFNDEGFLSRERAEEILASRGTVRVLERGHPRYVGAKIGIYNPQGERVGSPGPSRNRERLFVVTGEPSAPMKTGRAPVEHDPSPNDPPRIPPGARANDVGLCSTDVRPRIPLAESAH